MKKCISVLVLFALITAGAFAIDMSVGSGMLIDYSNKDGNVDNGISISFNSIGFGGYVFFDVTYVEIDVSFMSNKVSMYDFGGAATDAATLQDALSIGFTLLGKYPVELGEVVILSPLCGVGYNLVVSMKDDNAARTGDKVDEDIRSLSQLSILAGVGLDVNITTSVYLRSEAILRFDLPGSPSVAKDSFADAGFSPRIKVGIGFKL